MKWIAKCLFGNWLVIDEESNCLVEISGNEKNAKLIATAPEMLEGLLHMQDYVTISLTLSGHTNEQIDFILRKVSPVIKKATEL